MAKRADDKFLVERYGLEKCKQWDFYEEDVEKREEVGFQKMIENIGDLFDQIKKATGINVDFTYKVVEDRRGKRIEIESEDFAHKFKVIINAWKSMNIKGYGRFWYKRNRASAYGYEEDFSKPCPEVGYSMEIGYKYQHHDGGTNGADIGYATVSESKNWKWEFLPVYDEENPE